MIDSQQMGSFQYNGKHYKQLNGTATESPVSVVLAKNCSATRGETRPCNLPTNDGYAALTTLLLPFTKTKLTLFTTTVTNSTPTLSLPRKLKKMENFLLTVSSKPRQQRAPNDSTGVQKTDGYRQIT